jgi:putative redox protein
MMGKITLRWVEDRLMMASDSNGHSVVIGRSPDPGFEWAGIKPSDLLLMAVASCSAYDVVAILEKKREPLEGLIVTCSGDQLSSPPYTFTSIQIEYLAKGNVNPAALSKAIRLSEEKYCSVISTLQQGVEVVSSYKITDSVMNK